MQNTNRSVTHGAGRCDSFKLAKRGRRGVFEQGLLQLSFELFHEAFEIALRFTAVSKRTYLITLTDFEVPKILLAEYPFAAVRSGRLGIVFVSVVRHRAEDFSYNYFE